MCINASICNNVLEYGLENKEPQGNIRSFFCCNSWLKDEKSIKMLPIIINHTDNTHSILIELSFSDNGLYRLTHLRVVCIV